MLGTLLSFSAGGFFPGTTAVAALSVLALLVVFVSVARHPASALGWPLIGGVTALALFALWQLLSAGWSDAPGRAIIASHLTLFYVLVLTAAGLIADRPSRMRAVVVGITVAFVAASVAGLLSRTLPEVFPVSPGPGDDERLNFPLTYWNAVGIVGALGLLLCLGLTTSRTERSLTRILAAGAVPALAATVFFTFSRGSIAACVLGVLVMVALAPSRMLVPGFLAVLPTTAVAVLAAYQAEALARPNPEGPQAVAEGRTAILLIGLAVVAAASLRAVLDRFLDPRLERRRPMSRRTTAGLAAALVFAGGAVALAAGAPDRIERGFDRFVNGSQIEVEDLRDRLTDPGNNGRLEHWRVALDAFESDRLKGAGAGTYQTWWNERREQQFDVLNAHSLYLEVLGETGVAGLALLIAALLAIVAAVLARLRGSERALWAAVAGAVAAYLLETGADWVWLMPATTWWLFALGGAALARAPREGVRPWRRSVVSSGARLATGVALLVVAVTPVRVLLSQSHLGDAIAALRQGDCRATVASALSSARALGGRAEPYELLAYCDARLGYGALALKMIDRAIARDPRNWEYRYDRALVLASQGRDPRPALADAKRLNPLEPLIFDVRQAMGTSPRTWRRGALGAPLLLPVS